MTTDRHAHDPCKSAPFKGLCPAVTLALVLGALPMTQGCQSSQSRFDNRLELIEGLTRDRQYVEAARMSVDLIEGTSEDSPRYSQAVEAKQRVSLASQLDHARALSLMGEDNQSLELLGALMEEYPESPQVNAWHERTQRKLARKWFRMAREALANEAYGAARAAYGRVLEYDPNHPVAGLSIEDLERLEEYRAELADDYYNGGVRSVVDQDLSGARWKLGNSLKFRSENPKAERRIGEVDQARAAARAESARTLVEEGLYSAAAKEYAMAAKLAPDSKEIERNLAALRAEAKALQMLGDAKILALKGEIDRAEMMLKEGAAMTALQSDEFKAAVDEIGDTRIERSYQDALDLEQDFRFPEAIEAYGALLETRDFYKDTRARIDALEGYVASAEALYAEAAEATDDAKRLELLQEIDVFWPEYKDVAVQIRELKN